MIQNTCSPPHFNAPMEDNVLLTAIYYMSRTKLLNMCKYVYEHKEIQPLRHTKPISQTFNKQKWNESLNKEGVNIKSSSQHLVWHQLL